MFVSNAPRYPFNSKCIELIRIIYDASVPLSTSLEGRTISHDEGKATARPCFVRPKAWFQFCAKFFEKIDANKPKLNTGKRQFTGESAHQFDLRESS